MRLRSSRKVASGHPPCYRKAVNSGILYLVGTPIGNLGDITLRALEVLKQVSLVAAEDTRRTGLLLKHYGISVPQTSLHEHNERTKTLEILQRLRAGESIALVTDAGMPVLSDPGAFLVEQARASGLPVTAVPGPSALTAALSIAGLPTASFLFLGFAPNKKGRQTLFNEIAEERRAVVLYESPHRIEKTLKALAEVLSDERRVAICRELTKLHEEVVSGSAREVYEACLSKHLPARGEFVIVIGPC